MFALGDGSEWAGPGAAPAIRSRHSSQGGNRRSGGITTQVSDSRSPPVLKKEVYEVPLLISRKFRDVKYKTLVGISAVCDASWYSIDDQLCIWPFTRASSSDQAVRLIQCDGVVTCVDIGIPSPFCQSSFKLSKFMAVVCTENSVSLLGLDADLKQVVSENFFLQLPNSTLFGQAQISSTGRVFLMSETSMPNTLVEMKYKHVAGWFKSKCYFYYHSLLVGGGSGGGAGFLSSIFSKLVGKNAPAVANGSTGANRRVFIRPESSFKFFATLDGVNLNLHEFSSSPTCKEMTLGSWRHNADYDLDSDIRCVGRIAISDLVSSSGAGRSIIDVFVTLQIESNEPTVCVATENGELVFLRLDRIAGDLIISRSCSISNSTTSASSASKRQKIQTGWGSASATTLPALGNIASRIDGSSAGSQSVSTALYTQVGGSDISVIGRCGSTRISITRGDCMNFDMEVGGTVQRIVSPCRVGSDRYGSLVVPVFTGDNSSAPGSHQMPVLYILTGKGVSVLEPVLVGPNTALLTPPETVHDVMGILSGPPESVFQYKPMCVRAVSDDVALNTVHSEQDYASREGCVKPLSGGIWIGGMKKLAKCSMLAFQGQRVLTQRKREDATGNKNLISGFISTQTTESSSTCVVSFSEPALISVSCQLKNLIKFIRVVMGSCKAPNSNDLGNFTRTGCGRRMFMHGTSTTRAALARQQALLSLNKLVSELAELDQILSLLALVAKYPQSVAGYTGPLLGAIDVLDLTKYHPDLTRLCERLIQTAPAAETREIVESLRSNCPLILCSISPTIMGMFSPESLASIIHCAIANNAPVHLLLESVRALGRNNAQIEKSLSEVGLILRSLSDNGGSDAVIEALLDGLQERLNDEHVLCTVLAWSGNSLDERLNTVVFEYIFERGYQDKIHAVSGNCFLESFLAKHAAMGKKFAQVYAQYLVRIGKQSLAGDVLEKQAISASVVDLDDRVDMLELAQQVCPSSKRFETLSIAKFVQVPLRNRVVEEHRGEYRDVESVLLSISELFNLASELGYHDVELTCYLFAIMPDKDILKTWVELLFGDFSFWARIGGGSIEKGLMSFLKNLYQVSQETRLYSIWKRIEVIVAMIEYVHCQLVLSGRAAPKSWIAREFLESEMGTNVNQVVEIYSKIVREMSVWLSKIPRSNEFSSDATPSKEYLETYLADTVVNEIRSAMDGRRAVNEKKLLSVLILLRNHIKVPNTGLEELIGNLSSSQSSEHHASLPTAEGF